VPLRARISTSTLDCKPLASGLVILPDHLCPEHLLSTMAGPADRDARPDRRGFFYVTAVALPKPRYSHMRLSAEPQRLGIRLSG
jgi:hypothetical protein